MAVSYASDDEDDESCGFCIFMKAGGCKQEFKVRSAFHVTADFACCDMKRG